MPGGIGNALAHDVITRLAKLRSLFVIAQGSVFALQERGVDPIAAGRMLEVDYLANGAVRGSTPRLTVSVELMKNAQRQDRLGRELHEARRRLSGAGRDRPDRRLHRQRDRDDRAHRAALEPPSSLDAWEAHHRGLWHMYRFTRADNEEARHFFAMAVHLDPTFARAHAGLSFTHFQNAFQGWAPREPEVDRAFAAAGESLMADDRDPAAHWSMGRALWLRGRFDQSLVELEQVVDPAPTSRSATTRWPSTRRRAIRRPPSPPPTIRAI